MSGNHMTRKNVAQGTIEYLLLFSIVVVALLFFLRKNGIFQNALNTTYNININSMLDMADKILR